MLIRRYLQSFKAFTITISFLSSNRYYSLSLKSFLDINNTKYSYSQLLYYLSYTPSIQSKVSISNLNSLFRFIIVSIGFKVIQYLTSLNALVYFFIYNYSQSYLVRSIRSLITLLQFFKNLQQKLVNLRNLQTLVILVSIL